MMFRLPKLLLLVVIPVRVTVPKVSLPSSFAVMR